jgi:hypothetical protein
VMSTTHCPDVREGDCAVVLGQQGDDAIALDEYAELSGSIPHEALTSLGSRVPRVYWRDGQVVASATLAGEEWLDPPRLAGQAPSHDASEGDAVPTRTVGGVAAR